MSSEEGSQPKRRLTNDEIWGVPCDRILPFKVPARAPHNTPFARVLTEEDLKPDRLREKLSQFNLPLPERVQQMYREIEDLDKQKDEKEKLMANMRKNYMDQYDEFTDVEKHHGFHLCNEKQKECKALLQRKMDIINSIDKVIVECEEEIESTVKAFIESKAKEIKAEILDEPEDDETMEEAVMEEPVMEEGPSTSAAAAPAPKKRGRKKKVQMVDLAENKKYCYCKKDRRDHMIGCDAKGCLIEWYHYKCIGMTTAPVGNWHCRECTDKVGPPPPKKKK